MNKIKKWFLNEFWIGYNLFEKLFLLSMIVTQIIVFIVSPDTLLGIISGLAGVISVVLCAKGRQAFGDGRGRKELFLRHSRISDSGG